jgi:hypothetical protein
VELFFRCAESEVSNKNVMLLSGLLLLTYIKKMLDQCYSCERLAQANDILPPMGLAMPAGGGGAAIPLNILAFLNNT